MVGISCILWSPMTGRFHGVRGLFRFYLRPGYSEPLRIESRYRIPVSRGSSTYRTPSSMVMMTPIVYSLVSGYKVRVEIVKSF